MVSITLKPEYGPTLGRMLAPRWREASWRARAIVLAAGAGLVALLLGAGLTLENAHYSHGGPVPFHFSYRGLYRTAPGPGEYVRVRGPRHGALRNSFAVGPVELPPYSGSLSGELPMYALAYIARLRARYPGFALRGEGKTVVSKQLAYAVSYTARIGGRRMYGRDVLMFPDRPNVRAGLRIAMLTSPTANAQVTSPSLVGTKGVLELPLESLRFGRAGLFG
jgi:hypothetical protein